MPMISRHGICGALVLVLEETLLAASPITSINRSRAAARMKSEFRLDRYLSATAATARRAWSSMSRRSASSSGGLIDGYRLRLDTIAEVWAQESQSVQVHFPTEESLQLFLHGEQLQNMALAAFVSGFLGCDSRSYRARDRSIRVEHLQVLPHLQPTG